MLGQYVRIPGQAGLLWASLALALLVSLTPVTRTRQVTTTLVSQCRMNPVQSYNILSQAGLLLPTAGPGKVCSLLGDFSRYPDLNPEVVEWRLVEGESTACHRYTVQYWER